MAGATRIASVRTRSFLASFNALPASIRNQAMQRYRNYFVLDPSHPLLERHHLHDVNDAQPDSFAVTIAFGYRAVGFFDDAARRYVWYWCGSRAAYDQRFRAGR